MMLLVASPKLDTLSFDEPADATSGTPSSRSGGTESVAVSLLMVSVPIEYRVKDSNDYLYKYEDPKKLLEVIAHQYLSDYAASVDVDELMGPGRATFNRRVKGELQERLDEHGVGIEIVFVGIRDAHPPAEGKVAETFHAVVAAETRQAALIHAAEGEARSILTAAAGTEARAVALDRAIQARNGLPAGSPQLAKAEQRVEDLLIGNEAQSITRTGGETAALIARAHADATNRISRAAAKALTFGTQRAAYEASPELYRHRKRLKIFEGLDRTRKYLIVGDRSNVIIEHDTGKDAGLDQVLTEGTRKELDSH